MSFDDLVGSRKEDGMRDSGTVAVHGIVIGVGARMGVNIDVGFASASFRQKISELAFSDS